MKVYRKTRTHLALALLIAIPALPAQQLGTQGKAPTPTSQAQKEIQESLHPSPKLNKKQETALSSQDTLGRLIHDLDRGTAFGSGSPASKAYRSLKTLGNLMVPSLIAELDNMGPFGLNNAQGLLRSFPDESLAPLVERYLKDSSPIRQEFAAELLPYLSQKEQEKLFPLALESKRARVQIAGIQAMIRLKKPEEEILIPMLRVFQEHPAPIKVEILKLLWHPKLYRHKRGQALVQRALASSIKAVFDEAARLFSLHIQSHTEEQALEILKGKTTSMQRAFVFHIVDQRPNWPRFFIQALNIPGTNHEQILKVLSWHHSFIPSPIISRLLGSQEEGVLDLVLNYLASTKASISGMTPLLGLLDYPEEWLRKKALALILENGPELLLKSPRFLQMNRKTLPYMEKVSMLGRAKGGPWSKQMFALWRDMESYEKKHPIPRRKEEKQLLAQVMADNLTPQDWPLVQSLLLETPRKTYGFMKNPFTRIQLLETILQPKLLTPENQLKALALSPRLPRKYMEILLKQVGNSLSTHPPLPQLETTAIELIEKHCIREGTATNTPGGTLSHYNFAYSIFSYLLLYLPGDSVNKKLWAWLQSSNRNLAGLASTTLFERIQSNKPKLGSYYLATINSPFLVKSFDLGGAIPFASKNQKLRELICEKLTRNLILDVNDQSLQDFLTSLPSKERETLLVNILKQERKDWDPDILELLLHSLGEFQSDRFLPVLQLYLNYPTPEIKYTALKAISRMFSPKAVPTLLEALKDPDLRKTARSGLNLLDDYLKEKAKWEKLIPPSGGKK